MDIAATLVDYHKITSDELIGALLVDPGFDESLEIFEREMRDCPVPVNFLTWLEERRHLPMGTIPALDPLPTVVDELFPW
jgi:hypothetical protein